MFQTQVLEEIKTRLKFNKFVSENRAIYEIMRWNMAQSGHRLQYGACALHAG